MSVDSYTALVDGDILVYRCAAACEINEYTYSLENGEAREPLKFRYVKDAKAALGDQYKRFTVTKKTTLDLPENCLHSVKVILRRILAQTRAARCRIFLGGEHNFRERLCKEYKADRGPKPEYYELVRNYLLDFYGAELVHGQEVDDKLAQEQNYMTIICSIDKDLLQVPGAHYNWVIDDWKYITKEEGDEWFWIQMLVGDSVDNIKGIHGIGLLRAVALVGMFENNLLQVRGFVQGVYLEEFKSAKEFFVNAQLLYIRRSAEHNSAASIFQAVV